MNFFASPNVGQCAGATSDTEAIPGPRIYLSYNAIDSPLSPTVLSDGDSRLGSIQAVLTQWKVSDLATAELMKSFYQQMQRGKDPGRALRDAKKEMVHSAITSYAHPYYWAPFILAGAN